MNFIGGLAGALVIALYFGVIGFLISLLWRITIALEKMARHQLEIARDVKDISLLLYERK
jgi:predicted lipid-binding transport protein (Tim44 family)